MPFNISVLLGCVKSFLFFTIQIFDDVPSVILLFLISIASYALCFDAKLAAIIFGRRLTVLISLLFQRKSS